MLEFPQSTVFNRRIPKQKFYENLTITPQLKRVFIEQIKLISWRYKLSASTINIAAGNSVTEIEVFALTLNQRSLDTQVLQLIDKEIPYHILFVLEYDNEVQAWISYKEESQTKAGTFKPAAYYHTEWMPQEALFLRLDGLDMDMVYEGFASSPEKINVFEIFKLLAPNTSVRVI